MMLNASPSFRVKQRDLPGRRRMRGIRALRLAAEDEIIPSTLTVLKMTFSPHRVAAVNGVILKPLSDALSLSSRQGEMHSGNSVLHYLLSLHQKILLPEPASSCGSKIFMRIAFHLFV
ncbi:MAG: hypothetical protein ACLUZX_12250 [Subdoligranulum sp.]